MARRNRHRIANTIAAVAMVLAFVTGVVELFYVAVVAVTYGIYSHVATLPPVSITIERTLTPTDPVPGDEVDVELAITNVGDHTLPDLRIADDVPDALGVVDGSATLYTALRPGETVRHQYSIRAKRGEFEFAETTVVARSLSGGRERKVSIDAQTQFRCRSSLEDPPLRDQADTMIGLIESDVGGPGTEFFATRAYRTGDPMKRIDWNSLAKTGDLKTIQYRVEKATRVVLLVDVSESTWVAPDPNSLEGGDLCIYAAERTMETLLGYGNEVGLLFVDAAGSTEFVEPGAGTNHEVRIRNHLENRAADYRLALADGGDDQLDDGRPLRAEILRRLPANTQFLVFSPATADHAIDLTEQLRAHEYPVTVLSPDVTGAESVGRRLASLERRGRFQAIRATGGAVIDWDPDEAISLPVGRAIEQWL